MADTGAIGVMAELNYEDPAAALEWLAKAFGFETRMIVADADGQVIFAETGWDEHTVAVVPEQSERNRSPKAVGGVNTQTVRMTSTADIEPHCARARAAGAIILSEPQQFFFGRTYIAADPEGHIWSFRQRTPGERGRPPKGWTVRFPSRVKAASIE